MGLIFRKSLKFGPAKMNISRSGLGTSIGIPGFRIGVSPDGRRYISIGLPGTGLYWTYNFKSPPVQ